MTLGNLNSATRTVRQYMAKPSISPWICLLTRLQFEGMAMRRSRVRYALQNGRVHMVLNFAGEVEKRHLVVALANGVGIFAVLIYTSGLGSGLARWHDASYVEVF